MHCMCAGYVADRRVLSSAGFSHSVCRQGCNGDCRTALSQATRHCFTTAAQVSLCAECGRQLTVAYRTEQAAAWYQLTHQQTRSHASYRQVCP